MSYIRFSNPVYNKRFNCLAPAPNVYDMSGKLVERVSCPTAPILPTGVLAPSSGNLSRKMRQAQKLKNSTAHGGMKYISNAPVVDNKIHPLGKIYYTKYITFYVYAAPLTISQFFATIPWSNYGNTPAEALQLAVIYLTMLMNVQRRLSANILFPYYLRSNTQCADGVLGTQSGNDICCASSCGTCGGSGCSGRPGGAAVCCTGNIFANGVMCASDSDVGCIVDTVYYLRFVDGCILNYDNENGLPLTDTHPHYFAFNNLS